MSENKSENDGYVIEGNMEVAVKGHLVLYSVIGGRINYGEYSQRAQQQGLGKEYVPLPRRPTDAFAISKDILQNMQLPNLTEMEGWGSAVERRIIVKPLKRGTEYAVQLELSGTMNLDDIRKSRIYTEFVLKPQMASTLVSGGRVILIRFGMKKLKSQVMSNYAIA